MGGGFGGSCALWTGRSGRQVDTLPEGFGSCTGNGGERSVVAGLGDLRRNKVSDTGKVVRSLTDSQASLRLMLNPSWQVGLSP